MPILPISNAERFRIADEIKDKLRRGLSEGQIARHYGWTAQALVPYVLASAASASARAMCESGRVHFTTLAYLQRGRSSGEADLILQVAHQLETRPLASLRPRVLNEAWEALAREGKKPFPDRRPARRTREF
jgi:hypothetical protein